MGVLVFRQSDYGRASALYQEGLALFRELGDRRGIAAALGNLGLAAQFPGDYARARALHADTLALSRELDNKGGVAVTLTNLGGVAEKEGTMVGPQCSTTRVSH